MKGLVIGQFPGGKVSKEPKENGGAGGGWNKRAIGHDVLTTFLQLQSHISLSKFGIQIAKTVTKAMISSSSMTGHKCAGRKSFLPKKYL